MYLRNLSGIITVSTSLKCCSSRMLYERGCQGKDFSH
jgi:hypothetical protein